MLPLLVQGSPERPASATSRMGSDAVASSVRVLVVGDSGVGKSTLVQMLTGDEISDEECIAEGPLTAIVSQPNPFEEVVSG